MNKSMRHWNASDFKNTWFRRHRKRMATIKKKTRIGKFLDVSYKFLREPQDKSWGIGE